MYYTWAQKWHYIGKIGERGHIKIPRGIFVLIDKDNNFNWENQEFF